MYDKLGYAHYLHIYVIRKSKMYVPNRNAEKEKYLKFVVGGWMYLFILNFFF